jgi:integrase
MPTGQKKRSDGDGAVYRVHAKGCPRPKGARGKETCDCPWRGAFIKGYKRSEKTGKPIPIRGTVTAKTENGCSAKLREARATHEQTSLPVGKSPTLEQWLNHCHSTALPRQKKPPRPSTMETYRSCFDQYLIPLMGHVRLVDLTSDDIENAWEVLREQGNPTKGDKAKPLSGTTVHWAHTILARMLRLAVQKKHLAINPAGPDAMDAPSLEEDEVDPFSSDEWRKILDAAAGQWNAARWTVALAMGIRQGEALALRWSDVDLDNHTIRIEQTVYRLKGQGFVFGPPKSKKGKREFAIFPELSAELRKHRSEQMQARLHAGDAWRNDRDLVFTNADGGIIDPTTDRDRWRALLVKAGVQHRKLHAARHTAATEMLLAGVDSRVVMDILGWSQIATATRYRHAVDQAKRTAAQQIGAAFARS